MTHQKLWERYCKTLDRAIKRAGGVAKDPRWQWAAFDAYTAGYRAAQRDARRVTDKSDAIP